MGSDSDTISILLKRVKLPLKRAKLPLKFLLTPSQTDQFPRYHLAYPFGFNRNPLESLTVWLKQPLAGLKFRSDFDSVAWSQNPYRRRAFPGAVARLA